MNLFITNPDGISIQTEVQNKFQVLQSMWESFEEDFDDYRDEESIESFPKHTLCESSDEEEEEMNKRLKLNISRHQWENLNRKRVRNMFSVDL